MPASDWDGNVAGYVHDDTFLAQREHGGGEPLPVHDGPDGAIVGHMYDARSFVPLGVDPESVEPIDITVGGEDVIRELLAED
jgi:hypothetical protein